MALSHKGRKILGWTPILEPPANTIVTQAVIHCSDCGAFIYGVGGPKFEATCNSCVNKITTEKKDG